MKISSEKIFASFKEVVRFELTRLWRDIKYEDGEALRNWENVGRYLLKRYDQRIRARLEDMGLEIESEQPISVETIKQSVIKKSGLEVEDLSKEGVMRALDKRAARELSRHLGMDITTVFDRQAVIEQVRAQLLEKLAGGGKVGFLKGVNLERLRARATYKRAGLSELEVVQAKNRYYQRRYRRKNLQRWE